MTDSPRSRHAMLSSWKASSLNGNSFAGLGAAAPVEPSSPAPLVAEWRVGHHISSPGAAT